MPFADAAFANCRDLVCVTATDTAPLCGAHFNSGVRSYSAIPGTRTTMRRWAFGFLSLRSPAALRASTSVSSRS